MISSSNSSLLSDVELDEGIVIPVANFENKIIEDDILKKEKLLILLKGTLTENNERISTINEHLKNVQQELYQTRELICARKKEIETTNHMQNIATRERERIGQDILKIKKDRKIVEEQAHSYGKIISQKKNQIDNLKAEINWHESDLEKWLEESIRKEEDAITLIKYTKVDDGKIKNLSLKIKELSEESVKIKEEMSKEITNTQTMGIALDKTAEEFRRVHSERQKLITQWEYAVEQMHNRDKEMDCLAKKLRDVKKVVNQMDEIIKEKERFLENQQNYNKEQDKLISLTERQAGKLKLQYQKEEELRDVFNSELDTLKRTCDRTAMDLELGRVEIKMKKRDVVLEEEKFANVKKIEETLSKKLILATETKLSAEERILEINNLLNEEEKKRLQLNQDIKRLKNLHFEKMENANRMNEEEKYIQVNIRGYKANIRSANAQLAKLDSEALKQQEILYNQDFAIQQLERRVGRLQGQSSNEDKLKMEFDIKCLMAELKQEEMNKKILAIQLRRLKDDIRKINTVLIENKEERKKLNVHLEEIVLLNHASDRYLRDIINNKQELLVKNNMINMELKKIKEEISSKSDQLLTLEKRKFQLEVSMNERLKEISIRNEMYQFQIRQTQSEKHEVVSELNCRIDKINKLKKRYEILIFSMASNKDDHDEEKTQAFYVIKAAQEKEEAQRQGDELDAKLKKAEKEYRALENTLTLMNNRNSIYKNSFKKITKFSDEMAEKAVLVERERAVREKLRFRCKEINELKTDLKIMSENLDDITCSNEKIKVQIVEKNKKYCTINKDIGDQETRILRAKKQNKKLLKDLYASEKISVVGGEEKELKIRTKKAFNQKIMKELANIGQFSNQLRESLSCVCQEEGISLEFLFAGGDGSISRSSSSTLSIDKSWESIKSEGGSNSIHSH